MAGVKRAAAITRTGQNIITVWARGNVATKVFNYLLASWMSLYCHQLSACSTQLRTGKQRSRLLIKKKKISSRYNMPVQIGLKYETSDSLQDKSTYRVSLTQAGPCWSELHCHPTSAEDRVVFLPETGLLHITTSKSACCTACDHYMLFTHQNSERHGGICLHKHCKVSSKLRIMTWFCMTPLTAENMTSYMGPTRAAFSPDWPHYENKEQSLCSWSKYLFIPLTPTEVAWQVRNDFTRITVSFN